MDIFLNSYGTAISKDTSGFVIKSENGIQRIHADKVDSIVLGKCCQITTDAIALAVDNNIEIVLIDKSGESFGRFWSTKYGSVSIIRKGQLKFSLSADAVDWIKGIIKRKIDNQQALIYMFIDSESMSVNDYIDFSIFSASKDKIDKLNGEFVSDISSKLRGIEGNVSRVYFNAINYYLPPEYQFIKRSQHPAVDVANAMLNYGYGILYSTIESDMIKCGIDPFVGVFHVDNYNRPVLVYDFIELYRVWIDYVVFSLLTQKAINSSMYSILDDGSCWLESLGRRIMIQSVADYMSEKTIINSNNFSRKHHIFYEIQRFAQLLKTYKS